MVFAILSRVVERRGGGGGPGEMVSTEQRPAGREGGAHDVTGGGAPD